MEKTNKEVINNNFNIFQLKRPDLKGVFICSQCRKQFCHSSSLSRHKMHVHTLNLSRSIYCSEKIKKQNQQQQQTLPFNLTTKNNLFNKNNENNLTSVLHGFIVNGFGLSSIMKAEKEEKQLNNQNQSSSNSENQNNFNFKNSWHSVHRIGEDDISSQKQEKEFLNGDFEKFEEKSEKPKKNDCEIELNKNEAKKLENNNNHLFNSTQSLITTINDLNNKKEEINQLFNYQSDSFVLLENSKTQLNNISTLIPKKKKKKPYKELTLEQKVELIRLAERCTNLSQASIAERYAIAKSNLILNKSGSSVLHAHLSSHHKQKGCHRDILCRCCNLAFHDKNELNEHLKKHNNNNINDNTLSSEDVLLPTIEINQSNNSLSYDEQLENEGIKNILNNKIHNPSIVLSNNVENDKKTISSALQLLQQQQQNFLLANLWSNILHNKQQTEQNLEENRILNIYRENGIDEIDKHIRCSSATKVQENDNIKLNFGNTHSTSPSLNTCSSSSASSSVIVQTIKISTGSISSPYSSSYISTPPNASENDSSNTSVINENTEIKQQSPLSSPLFSSLINKNENRNQQQEHLTTDAMQQCQCALLKPKLQSNDRSSYLEAYNTTFQNELIRLNAKYFLAERIRQLELEVRQWHERNDILRFRLLECREKILAIIGGTHINGCEKISTNDLNNFLGEMLKITSLI
ncbi:HTH psq-type domain-containing protein [Meloidogyne graminicola]|uniref:HTH psq-type domain-containing protein n=1 Tax=Meloidogyne graminicola TaxID=189291 RepID=A0A8S9ZH80_9BILA|nr:HTH psq-type domain-containing protein [Meloidogyne graminicola]